MLDRKSFPNVVFNEYMIGGKVQLDLDEKRIFNNGGFISRNQTLYKCMVGSLLWLFNIDNSCNIKPMEVKMIADQKSIYTVLP
jgi:hypothetical protein